MTQGTSDQADLEQAIAVRWARGDSIGEARIAVLRETGARPSAQQVQQVFARQSHYFDGVVGR